MATRAQIRSRLKVQGIVVSNYEFDTMLTEMSPPLTVAKDYDAEEEARIIAAFGGKTVRQEVHLPQKTQQEAESGAMQLMSRMSAPLSKINDAFDHVEQAHASVIVERVRNLEANILTRAMSELEESGDVGVEILDVTFAALMPTGGARAGLKPASVE